MHMNTYGLQAYTTGEISAIVRIQGKAVIVRIHVRLPVQSDQAVPLLCMSDYAGSLCLSESTEDCQGVLPSQTKLSMLPWQALQDLTMQGVTVSVSKCLSVSQDFFVCAPAPACLCLCLRLRLCPP